jgi:predicted Zn-dependent protease
MTAALPRALRTCAARAWRTALVASLALLACSCRAPEPARSAAEPAVEDPRRTFERGKELARLGDSLRAEQYLARALERGHHPPETLRWLIGVCVDGARLRAAIHYARPYIEAHPEALRLRYVVATLYLGLGQPLPARTELRDIVLRAPRWAEARALLAAVEAELARAALARSERAEAQP